MSSVVSLRSDTISTLDLAAALEELDDDQRRVIEGLWGLAGEEPLTDEEIAEQLNWEINWVWRHHDQALQQLGYVWLTETLLPPGLERAA